ncbi:glutamate--tRNA ligase [Candidatus Micrarchaeota archaeon]|nr:glutamate--tRNA ligase [Candidatus Micrarchaeota archaeon]
MQALDSIISKHVLKNAYDYGKANAAAVVGKVIAEAPDCKKGMKTTMAKINAEIARVSKLDKNQIESEMSRYEYAEKKEEKKGLEIDGAEMGKVVVRYPPEPNGWPHIGHAKAFCLSWAIATRYKGKILLRWDDTNPEAEKAEFTDAIRNGIKWLGLHWDKEEYCSDHIPEMYRLCEKLISQGDAYACSCSQDEISKGREEKKRCVCGSKKSGDGLAMWKKMLDGSVPEGGATIRLKADMASDNTVMRDPTLFRIITTPHYRQKNKYRVWPTYDFQGAVMDSILGITHPIRSKEYELRNELYVFLLKKLGLPVPKMITIARLAIKNAPISKRLLRPLVETGKLWGWDDPRLPTLAGLKRRGILPEAIREFVLSFGISKVESEPDLEALLVGNRKLLDPVSPHYFFVPEPVELKVKGLEKKSITLKLHPKKDMGTRGSKNSDAMRELQVSDTIYIAKSDAGALKQGEIFRLKDLCNVKLVKKGKALSGELAPDSQVDKKIQWVSDGKLECEVLVPKDLLDAKGEFNPKSLESVKGCCERSCASLAVGDIVQFERFGFCRLDRKEGKLAFIFVC